MLERMLEENGLTDKEARVYLAVLEMGEASVSRIAAKTLLKRTTVYDVIETLTGRSILSLSRRKGVQYVSAVAPRSLVERFKSSASQAERLLPQLLELAYSSPLKPRMRFYDGEDGVREVLRDMSLSRGQVYGFGDYTAMPKELYRFIGQSIVPERRARGNFLRLLLPNTSQNSLVQSEDERHFREHRLVEFPDSSSTEVEILLYGGSKVGLLCFRAKEQFGVILDSSPFHDILRNLFLIVCERTPPR